MDKTNKISDFINMDIAYILGLIVGRGKISHSNNSSVLLLEFGFTKLQVVGFDNNPIDTKNSIVESMDAIIKRFHLLGVQAVKNSGEGSQNPSLIITFNINDVLFKLLSHLVNKENSDFHSFRIPKAIFQANIEQQKEFLRGYFDITGQVRKSNASFGNENAQRIYLEVDNRNWFLVLDLYKLIINVGVPIQSIDFGHPNFRDKNNKKGGDFLAKEHQIKIYANQFLPIGSYLKHKRTILEELASKNDKNLGSKKIRL